MIWTLNIKQIMTLAGSQAAVQMAPAPRRRRQPPQSHISWVCTLVHMCIPKNIQSKESKWIPCVLQVFSLKALNNVKTPGLFQCAVCSVSCVWYLVHRCAVCVQCSMCTFSSYEYKQGWGLRIQQIFLYGYGSGSTEEKNPDPTLNRNEEKNIFIF